MNFTNDADEYIPYFTGQIVDNTNDQRSILVLNAISIPLVFIICVSRLWVRRRMLHSFGLDDYLLGAGLIAALCLSISCLLARSFGVGKHLWHLGAVSTLENTLGNIIKCLYSAFIAYNTAISFLKLSLIATCFRIFPPDDKARRICIAVGALVGALWVSSIFATIFACVPVQAAWDFSVHGRCYPVVSYFYAFGAFNIFTDIALFLIPIPKLWTLNMARLEKIVLCVLFSLGTFTCVASIVRMTQLPLVHSGFDYTYRVVSPLNWSVIEVGTGMICVSIPALRPIVKRFLNKQLGSSREPVSGAPTFVATTAFTHPSSFAMGTVAPAHITEKDSPLIQSSKASAGDGVDYSDTSLSMERTAEDSRV